MAVAAYDPVDGSIGVVKGLANDGISILNAAGKGEMMRAASEAENAAALQSLFGMDKAASQSRQSADILREASKTDAISNIAYSNAAQQGGASAATVAEIATGALRRRHVHGAGVDDPVLWYEGAGLSNPKYLHADQQGSIIATANSAGVLNPATDINTYDEYGIPGAANTGRFGYTGQAWIPELGMYYYKARVYSPTMGRFLQTDPIGYDDQINLYAYVGNDPSYRDPGTLRSRGSTSSSVAYSESFYRDAANARVAIGMTGQSPVGRTIYTEGLQNAVRDATYVRTTSNGETTTRQYLGSGSGLDALRRIVGSGYNAEGNGSFQARKVDFGNGLTGNLNLHRGSFGESGTGRDGYVMNIQINGANNPRVLNLKIEYPSQ